MSLRLCLGGQRRQLVHTGEKKRERQCDAALTVSTATAFARRSAEDKARRAASAHYKKTHSTDFGPIRHPSTKLRARKRGGRSLPSSLTCPHFCKRARREQALFLLDNERERCVCVIVVDSRAWHHQNGSGGGAGAQRERERTRASESSLCPSSRRPPPETPPRARAVPPNRRAPAH